ncbi:MAG: nucleoside deaminase [Candidatus Thiodiazotropha sp. (ex Dulcina madagascariensis)]|nr:nucleoside deaminase [Candidatus Thiodiazotropha sp. (ex Dulcina madagascariensis)]
MGDQDETFMREALEMARQGIELGHGGPFGAVLVMQGRVIGRGWNQVIHLNDPTAHAEMQAIREACRTLADYHLPGAVLYTTCEPCPMCLSAAYWARIQRLVYAAEARDAAEIGFSDREIMLEFGKPSAERSIAVRQLLRDDSLVLFARWEKSDKRIDY